MAVPRTLLDSPEHEMAPNINVTNTFNTTNRTSIVTGDKTDNDDDLF